MKLSDQTFEFIALNNYQNKRCLEISEFYSDLDRFKYLKRLLRKYERGGELKERLILNHIIALYNVFPISICNELMFFRMETELWPVLKTFLVFLNYIPVNQYTGVRIDIVAASKLKLI